MADKKRLIDVCAEIRKIDNVLAERKSKLGTGGKKNEHFTPCGCNCCAQG